MTAMDRLPITIVNRRRLLAETLTACHSDDVRAVVADHLVARHGDRAAHEAMCIVDATVETTRPDAWAQSYEHTEPEELDAPMHLRLGGWIIALAALVAVAWGAAALVSAVEAATDRQIAAGAVEW